MFHTSDTVMSDDETTTDTTTVATTAVTSTAVSSAVARRGLSSNELAPYLVPLRAGDPLGLGRERPPAPPDPDKYDREHENKEFARSTLADDDRKALDADIDANGYMHIDDVRKIILENTSKGSLEAGGIDPEVMTLIDARINYKIFVAGDNIYARETLYDTFPFHEFNVQPEAIFVQQEIGIFPARKHAIATDLEYVARDVGDESVEFLMTEDLVGLATRKDYVTQRAPLRVVKTKIYIGKERWDDFSLMHRFFRGAARVANAHVAYGGSPSGIFAQLAGSQSQQLITDAATVDADREASLLRREEELNRREAEQRAREAEQREHAATVQAQLSADLARIEAMLSASSARLEPAPAECDDSVSL